jgi:oligopeptide/dipeptide ABC transporter ATP-binding protein
MALLELEKVSKEFALGGDQRVFAVDGVDLSVEAGSTVALIGESGSGKSTLGRLALRLLEPTSGTVRFEGRDLGSLRRRELRAARARMQIIFQEPYESLNPRMRVGHIIGEPLSIHRPDLDASQRRQRVMETLEHVGLPEQMYERYPGELSGGQQQRIGVARAIVTEPALVVLDEPTSSLDLSVRAQILQLLQRLQAELGMAYVFISHDIHTVRYMSDWIAVMYHGRVVESGPAEQVFAEALHPYTRALLASALPVDPTVPVPPLGLVGDPTPPVHKPTECVLLSRCPFRTDDCAVADVPLADFGSGRQVACINVETVRAAGRVHDLSERADVFQQGSL